MLPPHFTKGMVAAPKAGGRGRGRGMARGRVRRRDRGRSAGVCALQTTTPARWMAGP